jgi:hypothetical protein
MFFSNTTDGAIKFWMEVAGDYCRPAGACGTPEADEARLIFTAISMNASARLGFVLAEEARSRGWMSAMGTAARTPP